MVEDILFILLIFLSNIIQTITGFAGTVLAMPLSLILVGSDVTKPVLNLVAVVICIYIVIHNFKDIDFRQLLIILFFVGIGFALGFLVEMIPFENEKILLYIYGGIVIILAVVFFFVDFSKVDLPFYLMAIFLVLGGIIHKLFVSGGPFVVIYGMNRLKEKNTFRATLSSLWIILNSVLFMTQMIDGLFTPHVWILFGIGAGVSLLSLLIGSLVAPHLSS